MQCRAQYRPAGDVQWLRPHFPDQSELCNPNQAFDEAQYEIAVPPAGEQNEDRLQSLRAQIEKRPLRRCCLSPASDGRGLAEESWLEQRPERGKMGLQSDCTANIQRATEHRPQWASKISSTKVNLHPTGWGAELQ